MDHGIGKIALFGQDIAKVEMGFWMQRLQFQDPCKVMDRFRGSLLLIKEEAKVVMS
jgi:hypothetical protein